MVAPVATVRSELESTSPNDQPTTIRPQTTLQVISSCIAVLHAEIGDRCIGTTTIESGM
jgi:hypothetical protein